MPIPKTRIELTEQLSSTFSKLCLELDDGGPRLGGLRCADGWTVKELLAVRGWWTENVVRWVETGRRGGTPITPSEGYKWNETPRLNSDIARGARRRSYRSIRANLEQGFSNVEKLIDELTDEELLSAGVFQWAGTHPISRWVSLNTSRQYTTARTFIRRAVRDAGS